eukprot:1138706-Pelagomonas_calceolata.AAC.1
MEILEDGPYFGPAPVVFQAGPPWWWAGNESEEFELRSSQMNTGCAFLRQPRWLASGIGRVLLLNTPI